MHTGDYIRSVKFDRSMSGYKVADVDMFLDEVAEDMDKLVAQNRALAEKLNQLMQGQPVEAAAPAEPVKTAPPVVDNSQTVEEVHGLLVTAQRFSDQIVNEANEKAAAILDEANTKAREIDTKVATVLTAFEKDIAERKANADAEITKMLSDAALKSEGIITAAHDSVARQQLLFDKLKVEVADFKKRLYDNHKQQLEILQKFPDTVPYDPERAAKALAFAVDSEPDFRSFLPTAPSIEDSEPIVAAEEPVVEAPVAEETNGQSIPLSELTAAMSADDTATV